MKHLFFIIIGLFFVTSCGDEQFASVSDSDSLDIVASENQPKPEEKIQKLVIPEVKEKKIGAKERQQINIVSTVGKNELKDKKSDVRRRVTSIDTTNRVVVTTKTKIEDKGSDEANSVSKQEEEKLDLGPPVNILLYTNKRDWKTCMDHLRKNSKYFLQSISDYDWDISLAYYADANQAELMPLELVSGQVYNKKSSLGIFHGGLFSFEADYTLSKGEYSQEITNRLFPNTLRPSNLNHAELSSANVTPNRGTTKVINPLSGLDKLLSSSVRKETPTVVLYYGDDFSYNSTQEWNDFYSKHSNVSVLAISKRSSNVSNFLHVLEKGHNFHFIANCSVKNTLSLIAEQVK